MDAWVVVGIVGVGVGMATGGLGASVYFLARRPIFPSTENVLPLAMQMVETNAQVAERMMERTERALERAAFGPPRPPEAVPSVQIPVPPLADAPVWANWPVDGEVTDDTDRPYPDIQDWNEAQRGVGVARLPNFPDMTGEEMG